MKYHFPARYLAEDIPRELSRLAQRVEKAARKCAKSGSAAPAEQVVRDLHRCAFSAHQQIGAISTRLDVQEKIAERLDQQYDDDVDRVRTEALHNFVSENLADGFDPRGPFVYVLWGAHPDRPVYVGQSTNILARLGNHLGNKGKRDLIHRVQLIRCRNKHAMNQLEAQLIYKLNPQLNISGINKWGA